MIGKWYYTTYTSDTVLGQCVGENPEYVVLKFRCGNPWREANTLPKKSIISEGQDPRFLVRIWKPIQKLFNSFLAVSESLRKPKNIASGTTSNSKYQFIHSKKVPKLLVPSEYKGELNMLLTEKGHFYDSELECLWYFKIKEAKTVDEIGPPLPPLSEEGDWGESKKSKESHKIFEMVKMMWDAKFEQLKSNEEIHKF